MTSTGAQRSGRARRLVAAGATGLAIAAVCVSVLEGAPRRLPGIALESVVLFYAERALALIAITIAIASVVAHAARGRLPVELSTSGLRYEADAADDAAVAVAELQEQFDELVAIVDVLAERLDAPRPRP